MRDMATDFRDLFRWVDNELALNRTDTTHDFSSYLAEQMIEMKRKKNEETKGFRKRLDRIEFFILFKQVIRCRVYKYPLEKGAKGVVK